MTHLRTVIKLLCFAIAFALVSPLIALSFLEKHVIRTSGIFATCSQIVSLVPGPIGHYVRAAFYFGSLDSCSWQTHIGFGSIFVHRGCQISRNFSTGSYCVIGHLSVGSGVRMASRVSVPSGKRQHLDDSGAISGETHFDQVSIGSGCWIGEGAIVMADVGPDSIVSAGAVVLKVMPASSLVGGNPATVIRNLAGDVPHGADKA